MLGSFKVAFFLTSAAVNAGLWSQVRTSGPIVKVTLLLLAGLSVYTWAIIIHKLILYRRAAREDQEFLDLFWETKNLNESYNRSKQLKFSPVAEIFRSGYRGLKQLKKDVQLSERAPEEDEETFQAEGGMGYIKRTLESAKAGESARLEKGLNLLATTASSAPFIGLFGTVWGIMEAFQEIGRMGSANLAVVAPGISEALVATATGLAAAIPAVMAYNYFLSRTKALGAEMDSFIASFLNICERHFL